MHFRKKLTFMALGGVSNKAITIVCILSATLYGCASTPPTTSHSLENTITVVKDESVIGRGNNSQESEKVSIFEIMTEARLHAQLDYSRGFGFCLGAGCGGLGVAGSAIYEGSLPGHRQITLLNKSDEYSVVYREAYIKEIKRLRTHESVAGWAAAAIVIGVIYVFWSVQSY